MAATASLPWALAAASVFLLLVAVDGSVRAWTFSVTCAVARFALAVAIASTVTVLPWIKLIAAACRRRLDPAFYERIQVNAKCPACGHRNGSLHVRQVAAPGGAQKKMVVHLCLVCDATFAEDGIGKAETWSTPT